MTGGPFLFHPCQGFPLFVDRCKRNLNEGAGTQLYMYLGLSRI